MDLARQNRLKNSIPPKTKPAGNIGGFVNGLTAPKGAVSTCRREKEIRR
jgi:hypothetical protein